MVATDKVNAQSAKQVAAVVVVVVAVEWAEGQALRPSSQLTMVVGYPVYLTYSIRHIATVVEHRLEWLQSQARCADLRCDNCLKLDKLNLIQNYKDRHLI